MTNEEKKLIVDEACDLFNDAIEKISKAKKMLKKCGMEFCNGINEGIYTYSGTNLQMSKGIEKLSKITGEKTYFHKNIFVNRFDRSRKLIKYKGIVFLQLGEERTRTDMEYTFK